MKYKLKVYSIYEDGQRKDAAGNPHQEDSIFPAYGEEKDTDRLFILCDGMGGHDAGEVASSTVCQAMSESILKDGHDADGIFTQKDFENALDAAFKALDDKDTGAEKKMGTTMTFLKLHTKGATIAHIGDSRVYHLRPGKNGEQTSILKETEDHSLVNDLIKTGELTREEAQHSRQKNVITRAMQPHMDRRPKADLYFTDDIKAGDFFYLCSDGMLEQPEMEDGTSIRNVFSEMGGDDEHKVEILKAVTEKNRDNHSAIIVHILEVLPDKAEDNDIPDKFTAIVEDEKQQNIKDEKMEDTKNEKVDIKQESKEIKEELKEVPKEEKIEEVQVKEYSKPTSKRNIGIVALIIIIISLFVIFFYPSDPTDPDGVDENPVETITYEK